MLPSAPLPRSLPAPPSVKNARFWRALARAFSLPSPILAIALVSGCLARGPAAPPKPAGAVPERQADTAATVEQAHRPLPGVDLSSLSDREKRIFTRLAADTLAPCPSVATSVETCVLEARSCSACVPAARFLASRVRRGDSLRTAAEAYRARFEGTPRTILAGDSPTRGPESAPSTIVIWSDFECPACGQAVPAVEALLERRPGLARLVHKYYPLPVHPHARDAARAAYGAWKQGKYWEMETRLFQQQRFLEADDLERAARELGLDMKRFEADAGSAEADAAIERDRAEADALGLEGTPFLWINGRLFDAHLFRVSEDLESWLELEVELLSPPAPGPALASP